MTERNTAPAARTAPHGGVSSAALIALAVGVIALLAFALVAVWATSHGGSNVIGWPLWQGIDPRPR